GNVWIGTVNTTNSLTITTSPSDNDSHIFFGESLSTAGQASAKLTFAGLGIQHAGFSWVPGTTLDNGKLHLSFGGSNNGMNNPIKATFQSNGNVGIGTVSPSNDQGWDRVLDVAGLNHSKILATSRDATYKTGIFSHTSWYGGGGLIGTESNHNLHLITGLSPKVTILTGGNLGVGTMSPAYKLDVIGTIRAREVRVNLEGADFVFEDGYKLMPLNELEKFVKQNKHLPEIAPAKEMQEKGSDLGGLSVQLLQKIEELTLHVIEQNKKLEQQNKKIQSLEAKINNK
ncbi:MAG TPA: hypothetical protein VF677_08940, partial [Flavobacterium sp.]